NRSPGNSRRHAGSTHHKARLSARPSRPSNLFRCAFLRFSSRVVRGKPRFGRIERAITIKLARFTENGYEHWRNILQEIFGVGLRSKIDRVLTQFVCHLINDERASRGESIMRLPQEIAFLFDLQNTEGNS